MTEFLFREAVAKVTTATKKKERKEATRKKEIRAPRRNLTKENMGKSVIEKSYGVYIRREIIANLYFMKESLK